MRALVVDADAARRSRFGRHLLAHGFEVCVLSSLARARASARLDALDLLVSSEVDAELLRHGPDVRVICVLERRAGADALHALDLGADAVISQSASVAELGAVVGALLRRRPGLRLDPERRVAKIDRNRIPLSPLEFGLLELLARQPGALLARRSLLHSLWLADGCLPPAKPKRALDAHAARLRRKLRPYGWTLATVRGVGYRLEPLGRRGA